MQQEPIINHGTLIDTYNYEAIIRNQASTVDYMVTNSRPSKVFKPRAKKSNTNAKSRKLRKNNMIKK